MLVVGILTSILFIVSLIALIEFPGAFKALAIAMIFCAAIFLVLRSVHKYRSTFRVKDKKKPSP